MTADSDDARVYTVLVNQEEQYSIWPADSEIPAGWSEVGKRGNKEECLAHIGRVWTDMRPLSLRKWLAERDAG
ncbi:MAG TPA: MbtH family NRPS accessory protein [Polyangiaceae bacterium]|nr:MbtH family NRPS accessory protein [Polyangiaceae bacterium]